MSLLTAQACAAKASLISIRSSWSAVQPAFSRRLARGRRRAHPHDLRIERRRCEGLDRRQRLQAQFLRLRFRHHQHGGRAIVEPGGIARGDAPLLSNAGFNPDSASALVLRLMNSSASNDDRVALSLRDLHRDDLVLELAGVLRGRGLLLRGRREFVLRRAVDVCFFATFSAVMPMWYWL